MTAEASMSIANPIAFAIIATMTLWGLVMWWHDRMVPRLVARRERRRLGDVPPGPRVVDTGPRPLDKGWR